MELKQFMKLLGKAKKDRYGNLYVEEKELNNHDSLTKELNKNRWYFTLTNTVCSDLVKTYACKEKAEFEKYDRHSWNDDTLQIKIVKENRKQVYGG